MWHMKTLLLLLISISSFAQTPIRCDSYAVRGQKIDQQVTIYLTDSSVVVPIVNYDYDGWKYYNLMIDKYKTIKIKGEKYLVFSLRFKNGRKAYMLFGDYFIYFMYLDLEIIYRVSESKRL
jgi:hypothetical protein